MLSRGKKYAVYEIFFCCGSKTGGSLFFFKKIYFFKVKKKCQKKKFRSYEQNFFFRHFILTFRKDNLRFFFFKNHFAFAKCFEFPDMSCH